METSYLVPQFVPLLVAVPLAAAFLMRVGRMGILRKGGCEMGISHQTLL